VLNGSSRAAIDGALTVTNTLGCGFLKKVYEDALAHELRRVRLAVRQQVGATVRYDGIAVGQFITDFFIYVTTKSRS